MASLRPAAKSSEELQEFFSKAFFHTSALYGVAVGVHVGLFDVMAQFDKPATSQEIADKGDFKERYVREWLGCMVMAGLVSVDDTSCLYLLPHSHRKLLNSKSIPALLATLVTVVGQSLQPVCECFHKEGPLGTDYSLPYLKMYEDYQQKQSKEMNTWDNIKTLIEKVPGLTQALENGINVLDVGCSGSITLLMLAEKYPTSKFTGIDISSRMLEQGKKEIQDRGIKNIQIFNCDACKMPEEWKSSFDWVFSSMVIHDLPYVVPTLKAMKRVATAEGYISIIDVEGHSKLVDNLDNPGHALIYMFSLFHCMPLSLNSEGSDGMGAAWGVEQAREKIKEAGMELIGDYPSFGYGHYFICK